jgi:hypothetical protein
MDRVKYVVHTNVFNPDADPPFTSWISFHDTIDQAIDDIYDDFLQEHVENNRMPLRRFLKLKDIDTWKDIYWKRHKQIFDCYPFDASIHDTDSTIVMVMEDLFEKMIDSNEFKDKWEKKFKKIDERKSSSLFL